MIPNDSPSTTAATRAAGRSAELAVVRDAYRGACRGDVRLLLVDGPSASGKRSLIDAWLAEHRAGPVLRVDAGLPGTVETIVQHALARLSPVRRARHSARALLTRVQPGQVVDLLALAERRLRLREEVDSLLAELGADNPAVVVLDGLHDASRGTLDLLAGLVSESPFATRPKMLFVATLDGAPSGRIAELLGADVTRGLTLKPLDRDGIRAFLASRDVVDTVLALTGGHPELIEELLAGSSNLGEAGSVGIEETPAVRHALEAIAVAGHALDEPTLLDLVPELDPDALPRAGACLEASGWTLPARMRARIRTTMDLARIDEMHVQLAGVLDSARGARHALAAGQLERATELALAGAEELSMQSARVDAADLLLEITRAHDDPPIELRRRLVESLWIAGDHADAIDNARLYAERSPDGALLLGRLLALAGRRDEALSTLEHALATASLSARPLAQATLAEARYCAGDLDGAEALALEVRDTTELALALDAENTRGKVALGRGELERAEQILSLCLARADEASLGRAACQALNNLSIVAMNRGELGRATEHLERMLGLANTDGAVFFRGIAHKNLAVVGQLQGAWDRALSHAQRALSLLGGLGNPSLLARLSFNTADLHRSLGDPYRALRLCKHARELAAEPLESAVHSEGLRVEAAIHAELDHHEEAQKAWTEALAISLRLGQKGPDDEARLGLASLAIDAGQTDRARALLDALRDAAGSARTEARVALAETRLHEGRSRVPLARCAVGAAERTNDPLLVQVAHLELATTLAGAGLEERAREELATMRSRDAELLGRVPPDLRQLFCERRVVRGIAALERELGAVSPRKLSPSQAPQTPAKPVHAPRMVGGSVEMQALRRWIGRVGPTNSSVLITGESGTGKELVAEALHAASPRADRPFVRVNCAALVETLLSSELFGHERGAFTGADRCKKGRFELADGGTLLLDEIGDISPRMQASLLRVLQEQTFERVGGTKTHHVDVRLIAATHRDLAKLVADGKFREDLFYRLSGITVKVPALRERLADLPELCRHLLGRIADESGTRAKVLAPDAFERLAAHHWPGNVRELENALRSVAVLSSTELLTAADFTALAPSASARPAAALTGESLGAMMYERVREGHSSIYEIRKRLERDLIERALEDSRGNISKAAELLGMKRPRLSKLVNEWGLKK